MQVFKIILFTSKNYNRPRHTKIKKLNVLYQSSRDYAMSLRGIANNSGEDKA